jgi:hypothetical protein
MAVTPEQARLNWDTFVSEKVQGTKVAMLNRILDPNSLVAHCSLSSGNHQIGNTTGLGALDALSLELQHLVLGNVDVKTLLNFRRVNKKALDVVDGITSFKKVRDAREKPS